MWPTVHTARPQTRTHTRSTVSWDSVTPICSAMHGGSPFLHWQVVAPGPVIRVTNRFLMGLPKVNVTAAVMLRGADGSKRLVQTYWTLTSQSGVRCKSNPAARLVVWLHVVLRVDYCLRLTPSFLSCDCVLLLSVPIVGFARFDNSIVLDPSLAGASGIIYDVEFSCVTDICPGV